MKFCHFESCLEMRACVWNSKFASFGLQMIEQTMPTYTEHRTTIHYQASRETVHRKVSTLELQFALNQICRVGSPYCNAARFGAQLVQVRIMNLHHWAPNRTWGTNQTGKRVHRSPLGFLLHFDTSSGGDFSPVITITPLQPANQIPALVLILSAI